MAGTDLGEISQMSDIYDRECRLGIDLRSNVSHNVNIRQFERAQGRPCPRYNQALRETDFGIKRPGVSNRTRQCSA